jgi:glutamyl endopeptidase
MERKHFTLEKARQLLGARMDDVVAMVRQDRGYLRGWEEPAHLRCVLRRAVNDQVRTDTGSTMTATDPGFGRGAGEPEAGQQRECLGQILDAGASALEKMQATPQPELSPSERLGLECVLHLYVRPSLQLSQNKLGSVPGFWNFLESVSEDIELVQRGVGRLELLGHPEWEWAGTAVLVNECTLLTTRRTAESFCETQGQNWTFRPGITAWMDFSCEALNNASCRVRGVIGVHDRYDLALLDVEPSPQACPLVLSSIPASQMTGRPVYLVSFPVRDSRRSEPEMVSRIFRDVYGVKRVQPGQVTNSFRFGDVELMTHDCCTLGQSTGGCVVDLQTHQVVGLQISSRYLDCATVVPLSVLQSDPLMRKAGVNFSTGDPSEVNRMAQQLERLSRTRYWPDLCKTIKDFYQRACPV